MKHVGVLTHLLRHLRSSLHEVVIVGIDAGNHAFAQTRPEEIGQRHLLPLTEGGPRGQHHLKIIMLRLERPQQLAPEEHVFVALDIRHNLAARVSPVEAIGGGDEVGVEVVR